MKFYFFKIFFFAIVWNIQAQTKTFCDGFENGFMDGKASLSNRNKNFIVPICPVANMHQDTYDNGYSIGYSQAVKKETVLISENSKISDNNFENGYLNGYKIVMTRNKNSVYVTPIVPIAPINGDDYETGFLNGENDASAKLGIRPSAKSYIETSNGPFCEGWEKGYKLGLKEWATDNHRSVPLNTTPICPIAKINQDSYQNGFELGIIKARKDLEKK